MQFGDKVRILLVREHMTQGELARKAEVNESHLSMAITGRLNLRQEEIKRIQLVLGWPPAMDCLLDKLEGMR